MKVKTSELIGPALDWAVAKCEGFDAIKYEARRVKILHRRDDAQPRTYTPSTDWAQGGPIIERERITFSEERRGLYLGFIWNGVAHVNLSEGPTPLIAAMRCYVASKLGEEVEIPEELL